MRRIVEGYPENAKNAPPMLQNSGIFHDSTRPTLWRFAAEIAAIRRLYTVSQKTVVPNFGDNFVKS